MLSFNFSLQNDSSEIHFSVNIGLWTKKIPHAPKNSKHWACSLPSRKQSMLRAFMGGAEKNGLAQTSSNCSPLEWMHSIPIMPCLWALQMQVDDHWSNSDLDRLFVLVVHVGVSISCSTEGPVRAISQILLSLFQKMSPERNAADMFFGKTEYFHWSNSHNWWTFPCFSRMEEYLQQPHTSRGREMTGDDWRIGTSLKYLDYIDPALILSAPVAF